MEQQYWRRPLQRPNTFHNKGDSMKRNPAVLIVYCSHLPLLALAKMLCLHILCPLAMLSVQSLLNNFSTAHFTLKFLRSE